MGSGGYSDGGGATGKYGQRRKKGTLKGIAKRVLVSAVNPGAAMTHGVQQRVADNVGKRIKKFQDGLAKRKPPRMKR